MKYKIYAALREDINSGWVWVNTPRFRPRTIICINRLDSGEKVYCEALNIEENFLNHYNSKNEGRIAIKEQPSLVINEWYRTKLGDISTKSEYNIEIKSADNLWGKLMVHIHHPQVIVRVAIWLALIGIIEGTIGLILGFLSLC